MGKASSSSSKKGNKKKDKAKKKKGPKGKKARAKAKLQRQWGEVEVKDVMDKDPLQPRGQDVKAAAKREKQAARESRRRLQQEQDDADDALEWNNNDEESSSSSFDSDNDNDGNDDMVDQEKDQATVSTFLATIQKKAKRKRQTVDSDDDDDDDEDDDDDDDDDEEENTSRRHASHKQDAGDLNSNFNSIDQDDVINSSHNNGNNNYGVNSNDFFLERFSQPPLPEKEAELVQELKRRQETVKMPISAATTTTTTKRTTASSSSSSFNDDHDDHVELQLSKVWLEKHASIIANGGNNEHKQLTPADWKVLSTRALAGNREILKQNWIKIQKPDKNNNNTGSRDDDSSSCCPFSVLYPLLASYADVLHPAVQDDFTQSSMTQRALCLHILNHVMTTRTRIFKHNRKLKQLESSAIAAASDKTATAAENDNDNGDQDDTQQQKQQQQIDNDSSSLSWARDQGFTRPTVLVLLPTGGTCYTFVKTLLSLLSGNTTENTTATSSVTLGTVDNLERFETEYGPQDENEKQDGDDDDEDEQVANMTPEQKLRRKKVLQQKGPEWLELFADEVNDNDDFKMGIAIHPKGTMGKAASNKRKNSKSLSSGGAGDDTTDQQQQQQEGSCSVKLYADFYKSDIIVASPLGLKMSLAAADNAADGNGDDDNDNGNDDQDDIGNIGQSRKQQNRRADFLSSIEICLLARADVMYMQNWDHVQDVLARVNQPLENSFNVDFARVRPYHLVGQGQYWRQLILCSAWSDPLLSHTFTRHANSIAGLARIRKRVSTSQSNIAQVLVVPEIKQVFQRIAATSVLTQSQDRIEYFCQHLLPRMIRQQQRHTMIFVPNYLEFVSLRNRLLQQQEKTSGTTASTYCDFVAVTEYSRISETSRGRARFIQGRKAILLYTGRAHFFHRHLIKGARHLIFFGLPEYASFYSHHVNLLNDATATPSNKHNKNGNGIADDESGITLSCTVLFTKYESHALERIVGTNHCKRMVGGEKSTFFFVS